MSDPVGVDVSPPSETQNPALVAVQDVVEVAEEGTVVVRRTGARPLAVEVTPPRSDEEGPADRRGPSPSAPCRPLVSAGPEGTTRHVHRGAPCGLFIVCSVRPPKSTPLRAPSFPLPSLSPVPLPSPGPVPLPTLTLPSSSFFSSVLGPTVLCPNRPSLNPTSGELEDPVKKETLPVPSPSSESPVSGVSPHPGCLPSASGCLLCLVFRRGVSSGQTDSPHPRRGTSVLRVRGGRRDGGGGADTPL